VSQGRTAAGEPRTSHSVELNGTGTLREFVSQQSHCENRTMQNSPNSSSSARLMELTDPPLWRPIGLHFFDSEAFTALVCAFDVQPIAWAQGH
jgi:hypothetical protein